DGQTVWKCRTCSSGMIQHVFTLDEDPKSYSADYFSEHPSYFNALEAQVSDPNNLGNMILDRLSLRRPLPGKHLLDVGTASGLLPAVAKRRGLDAVGLDISEYACTQARAQLGIHAVCGTLLNHPFHAGDFDIITMMDVIEHLPQPRPAVAEAARLLKPEGLLAIMTPNFSSHRVWGDRWHGYQASYEHLYYFNRKGLSRLLMDTGFQVLSSETFAMVDLLPYYFPNLYRHLPGGFANRLGRFLSNKILRPLQLEHRLLVTARKAGT
ncbi:MAG: hypothetical protein A2340_11655, partial [Lentisphaerae bacterium RIFOXYB12_FULL_60_10]